MADKKTKSDIKALAAMLPTQGWRLKGHAASDGHTLEDLVRTAHAKHQGGEAPGLISKIENEFELDMVQLQELWMYLGLPM